MSQNPVIEVSGNVKVIKSGDMPTTLSLPDGYIAFGMCLGEYRIFGNVDGEIVDLTNFVVTSPSGTIKGRVDGQEGPTQDLPFEQLKYLLGVPIYKLTGDQLDITARVIPD
jgi:hypothetical protein